MKLRWSHLSIKARLVLTTGLLLTLLLASAINSQHSLDGVAADVTAVYRQGVEPIDTAGRIARANLENSMAVDGIVARAADGAFTAAKFAEIDGRVAEIDGLVDRLQHQPLEGKAAAARQDFLAASGAYRATLERLRAVLAAHEPAGTLASSELPQASAQLQGATDRLLDAIVASAGGLHQAALASASRTRNVDLAASLAAFLVGVLLTWVTVGYIARSLGQAVAVANRIAGGELGHRIDAVGTDEVARLLQALASMDERLGAIVGEVRMSAAAVSGASQQIATGADDLAQRTQEQAASLEETAASMEEITATVKHNADHTNEANALVKRTREEAARGSKVAEDTKAAIGEINASSQKIRHIVGMIDEIAFQTNLLALNAAVEAARAGEAGRGFAVVASEVRTLSQRSAAAAREIKQLIEDAGACVDKGSALVDASSHALAEIVASVRQVSEIVDQIAAAGHEQAIGVEQVDQAVNQMNEVTQQNAALVQEASAAAHEMSNQAGQLNQQIAFFRLRAGSEPQVLEPAFARRDAPAPGAKIVRLDRHPGVARRGEHAGTALAQVEP